MTVESPYILKDDDLEEDEQRDTITDPEESRVENRNVLFEEICLTPGEPQRLEEIDFSRRRVNICTGEGRFLGYLRQDIPGNRQRETLFNPFEDEDGIERKDASYTYVLPNGFEILLPVPHPEARDDNTQDFVIGKKFGLGYHLKREGEQDDELPIADQHCNIRVLQDGAVLITDLSSPQGTVLKLSDERMKGRETLTTLKKLPTIRRTLRLRIGKCLVLCDGRMPLGQLYKVPDERGTYAYRDYESEKLQLLDGEGTKGHQVLNSDGKGFSLLFNDDGELGIKADGDFFAESVVFEDNFVEAGQDGEITAFLNGGRKVVATTNKGLGATKYAHVNEDNVGVSVHNSRIVVADGLGGHQSGHLASHLAVRQALKHKGSLSDAIHNASYALQVFSTRCTGKKFDIFSYKNAEGERVKSLIPVGDSDTVLVAAQLKGDMVDLVSCGDSRWYIVHKGKVIARNQPQTAVHDALRAGLITERDAYTQESWQRQKSTVTATLRGAQGIMLDDNQYLPPDSWLLLCSDGMSMLSEEEIAGVLESSRSVEEGVSFLRAMVQERNKAGHFMKDLKDGGEPVVVGADCDNVTIALYRHEGSKLQMQELE